MAAMAAADSPLVQAAAAQAVMRVSTIFEEDFANYSRLCNRNERETRDLENKFVAMQIEMNKLKSMVTSLQSENERVKGHPATSARKNPSETKTKSAAKPVPSAKALAIGGPAAAKSKARVQKSEGSMIVKKKERKEDLQTRNTRTLRTVRSKEVELECKMPLKLASPEPLRSFAPLIPGLACVTQTPSPTAPFHQEFTRML